MSAKITEYCFMKKIVPNREDSGTKRRLSEDDGQSHNRKFVKCDTVSSTVCEVMLPPKTPSVASKSGFIRHRLIPSSPEVSTQNEISWKTVSPDCASRIQPRKLDERRIQEDVATTIQTYLPNDASTTTTKRKESGILDDWLNRTDTAPEQRPQPPSTPKLIRENKKNKTTKLSVIKLMLESTSSSIGGLNSAEEHKSNLNDPDNVDVWDSEEYFNNPDFLETTQKMEVNYKNQKLSHAEQKLPLETVPSTSKTTDLKGSVFNNFLTSTSPVKLKTEIQPSKYKHKATFQEQNILKMVTESSREPSKLTGEVIVINSEIEEFDRFVNEDDEIDKLMCSINYCGKNEASDDLCNAPTQILNVERHDVVATPAEMINESFQFDSDDTFGADFDV